MWILFSAIAQMAGAGLPNDPRRLPQSSNTKTLYNVRMASASYWRSVQAGKALTSALGGAENVIHLRLRGDLPLFYRRELYDKEVVLVRCRHRTQ